LVDADGVSDSCNGASPSSEEDEEDEEDEVVFFSTAAAAFLYSLPSAMGCSVDVVTGGGEVPAMSLILWLLAVCYFI
jgi:hypothetical protein